MKLEVIKDETRTNPKYKQVVCDLTDFLDELISIGKYSDFDNSGSQPIYAHYIWQDVPAWKVSRGENYVFDFRVPGHTCGGITVNEDEEIVKIDFIDIYKGHYQKSEKFNELDNFIGQKLEGIIIK